MRARYVPAVAVGPGRPGCQLCVMHQPPVSASPVSRAERCRLSDQSPAAPSGDWVGVMCRVVRFTRTAKERLPLKLLFVESFLSGLVWTLS